MRFVDNSPDFVDNYLFSVDNPVDIGVLRCACVQYRGKGKGKGPAVRARYPLTRRARIENSIVNAASDPGRRRIPYGPGQRLETLYLSREFP